MINIPSNFQLAEPYDTFQYECSLCGNCCRNVRLSVMVESYDLYRISRHLKRTSHNRVSIESMISENIEIYIFEDTDYPVFLLKTRGDRSECIFLKDGRCSIQDAKPRVCKLYPLGAWPNDALDGFDYFLIREKQHHYIGPETRVGDWMDENLSKRDRRVLLMDARSMLEMVPILRRLKNKDLNRNHVQQLIIYYKFLRYDLSEPYIPQFVANMERLMFTLRQMAGCGC